MWLFSDWNLCDIRFPIGEIESKANEQIEIVNKPGSYRHSHLYLNLCNFNLHLNSHINMH